MSGRAHEGQERAEREPNGGADRIDQILGHLETLDAKVQKAIDAGEHACNAAFGARDAARDAKIEAKRAADNAKAALSEATQARASANRSEHDIGKIMGELGIMRKLIGNWPASPDDSGTGLAGRVALTSAASLERFVPAGGKKSTIPPALVTFWKKTQAHRRVATLVAIVFSLVYAAAQAAGVIHPGAHP